MRCWESSPSAWRAGSARTARSSMSGTKEEYEEIRQGYGPDVGTSSASRKTTPSASRAEKDVRPATALDSKAAWLCTNCASGIGQTETADSDESQDGRNGQSRHGRWDDHPHAGRHPEVLAGPDHLQRSESGGHQVTGSRHSVGILPLLCPRVDSQINGCVDFSVGTIPAKASWRQAEGCDERARNFLRRVSTERGMEMNSRPKS